MKLKKLCFSFLFFTSLQVFAAEATPSEAGAQVSGVDAKAKEDCAAKDKVAAELDNKKLEVKAAEDKALQKLGLLAETKPKVDPNLVPVAKMETCK